MLGFIIDTFRLPLIMKCFYLQISVLLDLLTNDIKKLKMGYRFFKPLFIYDYTQRTLCTNTRCQREEKDKRDSPYVKINFTDIKTNLNDALESHFSRNCPLRLNLQCESCYKQLLDQTIELTGKVIVASIPIVFIN